MIIKQIYLLYIYKSTALDEQCDFSDGWSDLCDGKLFCRLHREQKHLLLKQKPFLIGQIQSFRNHIYRHS